MHQHWMLFTMIWPSGHSYI